MDATSELERGRTAYRRQEFAEAFRLLRAADDAEPLAGDDLDLLSKSGGLIGRDEESMKALERAHQAHRDAGETEKAARSAFWLGFWLVARGNRGQGSGWLTRAQRLLEGGEQDCVERGYLLVPAASQLLEAGDWNGASAAAAAALGFGERFGDGDLVAFARTMQGHALMRAGRVEDGIVHLDEAMVGAAAGELSPLVTGLIYCRVIWICHEVYALDRCREWTSALARWCDEQSSAVTFTGTCLVHRAEILQWNGAWRDALEEARRATERLGRGLDDRAAAPAFYQEAEVHRLRGEFAEAEEAYRNAGRWGSEPQPGLALLRLAQGQDAAAAAQMRRVIGATSEPLQRTRLLPAHVEIMVAVGDLDEARRACAELEEVAARFDTEVLTAMAAHARGSVKMAEGDAQAALEPLRRSLDAWQQLGTPYLAARVRVLVGQACRALGDEDGFRMAIAAAREVFENLGAAPELARLSLLTRRTPSPRPHGLTPRELQVLLLVAAGKTNRAIASELFLSEKTVDRHVSNIFTKLDVSSRSAATAFAYENRLL